MVRTRRQVAGLLVMLVYLALMVGGGMLWWRGRQDPREQQKTEQEARVRQFCSTCHRFPPPETLPARYWQKTIDRMYQIVDEEQPCPPEVRPSVEETLDFYTSRAPYQFTTSVPLGLDSPSPVAFRRRSLNVKELGQQPAVSTAEFVHLLDDDRAELLICDLRYGAVVLAQPQEEPVSSRLLAAVPKPCQLQIVDLDRDGQRDLLLAELGVMRASDTRLGSVLWLRGDRRGRFQVFPLITGQGRVSDARAADFDGDGDLDVVVAVFGFRKVGGILYLENETTDWTEPEFTPYALDGRVGASHVPIADLDGDGCPDFVALISQHFETIVAFLNWGPGTFEKRTIFEAEHPNWGCATIELVDLDRDGDLDVVLAHGDTLDDYVPKPYHGVAWLENRGDYPFVYHQLAQFPGAYCARTGDLDNDGDLDIVAGAFLPFLDPSDRNRARWDSLLWLEQVAPGQFRRHALERGTYFHAALSLEDFDKDGDLDIAVGNFVEPVFVPEIGVPGAVTLWENLAR